MYMAFVNLICTFIFLDNIKSDLSSDDEDKNPILAGVENIQDPNIQVSKYPVCKKIRKDFQNINDENEFRDPNIQVSKYPVSKFKKDFRSINDEKELRIIKLREAIEQQRELHSKKIEIADVEVKIVLLKLSMAEEKVQMESESL